MAAYRRFMTHVTCRLTAKNRDQLRNSMLGNRVWATFFTNNSLKSSKSNEKRVSTSQLIFSGKRNRKCTASQSEKPPHARTDGQPRNINNPRGGLRHTSYRPGGGDTICPPTRRRQFDSRRIYVRPRAGPQSAHLWWPACRQPRQLRHASSVGWNRRTDRGMA